MVEAEGFEVLVVDNYIKLGCYFYRPGLFVAARAVVVGLEVGYKTAVAVVAAVEPIGGFAVESHMGYY